MESHNDDPSGCQEDEIFPRRAAAQTERRAWSALTDDVTAAAAHEVDCEMQNPGTMLVTKCSGVCLPLHVTLSLV